MSDSFIAQNSLEALLDAATSRAQRATSDVLEYKGRSYVVRLDHRGWMVQDLTAMYEEVKRRDDRYVLHPTGRHECNSLDGLADLVARNAVQGETVIFFDAEACRMEAVFDYHPAGGSGGRAQHTASYRFRPSAEVNRWRNLKKGQADFCRHLLDFRMDVIDPSRVELAPDSLAYRLGDKDKPGEPLSAYASLLSLTELARSLYGERRRQWKAVEYDRFGNCTITQEDSKGVRGDNANIPSLFLLDIPMFEGGESVVQPAQIQPRVDDEGRLSIAVSLVGYDRARKEAQRQALDMMRAMLATRGAGDVPVIDAAP